MAKLIFLLFSFLIYQNFVSPQTIQEHHSAISLDILPDGCKGLLQLFAHETANFTLCIVTNARPITVCKYCVNEYNQVLMRYENIEKLHNNDSMKCQADLTNIDRLQIVDASYKYVINIWKQASCELCLNGTVLNGRTEHVINLGKQLDNCISKHKDYNLTICTECKDNYKNLINYYNEQKIKEEFCMDVVDLINSTQIEWSSNWKCHVSNYHSEWVLLTISFIILLLPILFYFINWLLYQERSNILLYQNRWHQRFINNAASTSGYVAIS